MHMAVIQSRQRERVRLPADTHSGCQKLHDQKMCVKIKTAKQGLDLVSTAGNVGVESKSSLKGGVQNSKQAINCHKSKIKFYQSDPW